MKKYIIVILLAIFTGTLLAIFVFQGRYAQAKSDNSVFLFQIGVYKSLENAKKVTNTLESSIVIQEGDYYHVYSNIFISSNLVNKISNYLNSRGIHYYIKNIKVDDSLYKTISEYEQLLFSVDDIDVINKASVSLLQEYQKYRGLI